MVFTEYFWIKKDPDAPTVINAKNFTAKNYPYFIDEKIFSEIDDGVAYYSGDAAPCDILFEPTFLIGDRFKSIFEFIEPDLELKGVQLYKNIQPDKFPAPLFWLPYLPCKEVFSPKSIIYQGKPEKLFLRRSALPENRLIHCKLPAADIWIVNLEAAECLLRRQPVGIILQKIEVD